MRVIEEECWMYKALQDSCCIQFGVIIFVFHFKRNPHGNLFCIERFYKISDKINLVVVGEVSLFTRKLGNVLITLVVY